MKIILATLTLAVAGVSSAGAQIFNSNVAKGAALGGVAGAFIGGHNDDRWAQGAVIGAAAGALIGAAVDSAQSRDRQIYAPVAIAPMRYVSTAPTVYVQPARRVVYVPSPRVVHVSRPPAVVHYVPARPVVVVRREPVSVRHDHRSRVIHRDWR